MTKDSGEPEKKAPPPGEGPQGADAAGPPEAHTAGPPKADVLGPPEPDAARLPEPDAARPPDADAARPPRAHAATPPEPDVLRPPEARAAGPAEERGNTPSDGLILTLLLGAAALGAAVGAWVLGPVARWLLDVLPVVPFRIALRFLGAIDVGWEMLLAGAGGAVALLLVTLGALERREAG